MLTVSTSLFAGYAISQLRFPGRTMLYWLILASFMVPTQTLIISHFVLIANMGLLNTWAGIILPQLIHPVIIIVYKQFFDQVPKDFREAAAMDNASEFRILFKIYIPMNWGSRQHCQSSHSFGLGMHFYGHFWQSQART